MLVVTTEKTNMWVILSPAMPPQRITHKVLELRSIQENGDDETKSRILTLRGFEVVQNLSHQHFELTSI